MVKTEKEKLTEEKAKIYLKKLEEKLIYYKQNVINSSDAIIVQDFNGNIKAWNPGAEKIYGFKEKEMLGKNITKIITKRYQKEARKNISAIKKGKPTFRIKQLRKTKNNQEIFVNITYSPIYENEEIIEVGTSEENVTNLRESEIQFRQLFNNMDEAVAIYEVKNNGKDIVIKDLNKSAEELEKIKKENILGKRVDKVFKGVKKFGLYNIFKQVWKTGKPVHHPISFYKDKYHQGWRENFVFKLPSGNIVAIYSDVTERKYIEQKLRESEEKYRNVSEKANDGIAIIQNGIIKYGNPALAKIREDSLKNIINKNFLSYIAPEEIKKIENYYKKRISGEKVPSRYETILLKKDGTKIYVELNAGIINYESKPADLVIIRDITEMKESQEKKYKLLYESSADAIMTLEPPKWKFTSGNPMTLKMFKLKNEKEFTSKAPWEYSPKYQLDGQNSSIKAKQMILKAMKEGSNFFEWTHKRVDGENFPATVLLTKVKEGEKVFLQATIRDITEQKKAEEKTKEAELMKTEFMSAISHELRTPITPIKAQLQRMLATELSKQEQKDSIEIALRNTIRMDRLVQDLLEITRIKSGKFNIFKKKENINEIIENAIVDLNSFAKEKNTSVIFTKGKIPEINIDKDRIIEVIINILDNAIKYGKGKISIETKKENKNILIKIEDNGIGIPKEETGKIFSPFYRGKRLEEQKYEGTGLGLSICKGIIEAHKGKISFESKIGKGTMFTINLPIQ